MLITMLLSVIFATILLIWEKSVNNTIVKPSANILATYIFCIHSIVLKIAKQIIINLEIKSEMIGAIINTIININSFKNFFFSIQTNKSELESVSYTPDCLNVLWV